MPVRKYFISTPTRVLVFEEERQVAHTIPRGAVVTVDPEAMNTANNTGRLIEVTWIEKKVMMFAQDLRSRGDRID